MKHICHFLLKNFNIKYLSIFSFLGISFFCMPLWAEENQENESPLEVKTKALMVYRQFQSFDNIDSRSEFWQKTLDLRHLSLRGEYHLDDKNELEVELEIEHGGTGAALEYEPLEEFGEVESEIEKGGEIQVEELYYKRLLSPQLSLKVGKIPVFISLNSVQENQLTYPTLEPSRAEKSMLPSDWRELGIELKWNPFSSIHFRGAVTNGLNSEFFRSYNWIGGGTQRHFEEINSEDLAFQLSAEYGKVKEGQGLSLAIYHGNTSGNRVKKNKLTSEAHLFIASAFGSYHFGRWGLRGQLIRGFLQNADKISYANSTLSQPLSPGIFSPLGSEAHLEQLEFSYLIRDRSQNSLSLFLSYEHVNTLTNVRGSTFPNDRYNQLMTSTGLLWIWDRHFFLKANYSKKSTALTGLPDTDEYQLGFGFDSIIL